MNISLSPDQLRLLRLCAQRLTTRSPLSATQLLQHLCCVQAQEAPAASLSLWARGSSFTSYDIEHARSQERSIVRTWALRGTLHLVTTHDLHWLLPLLRPVFVASTQRRRTELGLDEPTYARGIDQLRALLTGQEPLLKAEVAERLAQRGLQLHGQALPHLLLRAALEGVICLGPEQGSRTTYVLFDEWIKPGQTLSHDATLAELARRYLAAYAPAEPEDFAHWSGLPLKEIRDIWKGIDDQLFEVRIDDRPYWMLLEQADWLDELLPASPIVRLLPDFDTYLLGYKNRDLVIAPQHKRRIHPGGGLIYPTLLVDGYVQGTWKSKRSRQGLEVIIEPFNDLSEPIRQQIEAEVADMGRFLQVQIALHIAEYR